MSFNPNPTPGSPPKGPFRNPDDSKSSHQQIAETQDTLDKIKCLIETLQEQLDCLKGCQKG